WRQWRKPQQCPATQPVGTDQPEAAPARTRDDADQPAAAYAVHPQWRAHNASAYGAGERASGHLPAGASRPLTANTCPGPKNPADWLNPLFKPPCHCGLHASGDPMIAKPLQIATLMLPLLTTGEALAD